MLNIALMLLLQMIPVHGNQSDLQQIKTINNKLGWVLSTCTWKIVLISYQSWAKSGHHAYC